MPVFTITGLTLKEALRRRTLAGALVIGMLILGLSLVLIVIHSRFVFLTTVHARPPGWYEVQYPVATGIVTSLCLSSIRVLGSIFAILLAGGAISAEIERGLLNVILSKPVSRWMIFTGKWIGLNLILTFSVLFWSVLVWASISWQTQENRSALLVAGLYLCLFPIVICTVTLTLSTVAPRLLGTAVALAISAFSWFDGILNGLGTSYDTDVLHSIANFASVLMPQGCIAWWIRNVTQDIIVLPPAGAFPTAVSPQYIRDLGIDNLKFAHLDAVYLVAYIVVAFLIGVALFNRRDV